MKQYTGAGFSDLLRKAVSLEAYNYSRLEGRAIPLYMLAENMSARKCGPIDDEKDCYAVVKNRTLSGKKKHVTVSILNEDNVEVYDFTFDYYLWEQSLFEDKFSFLRSAMENAPQPGTSTAIAELILQKADNDYSLQSLLPAFNEAQCADHYPGYPCVPAIYIYQSLMNASLKWLKDYVSSDITTLTQDFMELLPVKMIPVGIDLTVFTKVLPVSKKRFRFLHEIREVSSQELHLIVTTDVSIP